MRLIRSKDTKVEMVVRRLVHRLGYRYRLHYRSVPGSPDIALVRLRKAIFIHGCFWHGHRCKLGRMPKSRIEFWSHKIETNRKRDARVRRKIRAGGWRALVIWECQLNSPRLENRIRGFLNA